MRGEGMRQVGGICSEWCDLGFAFFCLGQGSKLGLVELEDQFAIS